MKDIENRQDIELIIIDFYHNLMKDPLIGHFFKTVRTLDLKKHIPLIVDFWENILFQTGSYRRNAMHKHFELHDDSPILKEHFTRWLLLFEQSTRKHFKGPMCNLAFERAKQIAGLMKYKIETR
jgi:hemoglobin